MFLTTNTLSGSFCVDKHVPICVVEKREGGERGREGGREGGREREGEKEGREGGGEQGRERERERDVRLFNIIHVQIILCVCVCVTEQHQSDIHSLHYH